MATNPHRADLQGLRGLAVLSVLGFHFLPAVFPNGYVGVDQFFVLSGFLIAMVLDKEDVASVAVIGDFYYRRVKRILPMYLLVILLTLVSALLVFPPSNLAVNVKSAKAALLFVSNLSPLSEESNRYSSMLSLAEDMLTHTWSVAVEMQFYLLMPFLAIMLTLMPGRYCPIFLLAVGGCSFALHTQSNANTSFYSVFSRIWQFLTGNAAYLYSCTHSISAHYKQVQEDVNLLQTQDEECYDISGFPSNSWTRHIFVPAGATSVLYSKLYSIQFRVLIAKADLGALSTKFLEALSEAMTEWQLEDGLVTERIFSSPQETASESEVVPNKILSHSLTHGKNGRNERIRTVAEFACLSVLSFAMLFPSPLHPSYLRITTTLTTASLIVLNGTSIVYRLAHFGLACGLISSWFLAVLLTQTFEKFYRSSKKPFIICLIVVLYTLNYATILFSGSMISSNRQEIEEVLGAIDAYSNITTADAVKLNAQFTTNDQASLIYKFCSYTGTPPFGLCRFKELNETASATVLIVGNSWAANHARPIHESCKNRTKSMTMYSVAACEVLVETHYPGFSCTQAYLDFSNVIQNTNPDYLFIIERHLTIQPKEDDGLNATAKESLQQQVVARLQSLEKFVGTKIFILDAMPRLYLTAISTLNSRITGSKPLKQTELIEQTDVMFARQTIRRAIRSCKKCVLISYDALFGEPSNFRVFNERTKLAYFTRGIHLSPYGLNIVTPTYEKICSLF